MGLFTHIASYNRKQVKHKAIHHNLTLKLDLWDFVTNLFDLLQNLLNATNHTHRQTHSETQLKSGAYTDNTSYGNYYVMPKVELPNYRLLKRGAVDRSTLVSNLHKDSFGILDR